MTRRALTLAPLLSLLALWAGSYRVCPWATVGRGVGAFADRGAVYFGDLFDDAIGLRFIAVGGGSWEAEYRAEVNRWLPWRRLGTRFHVVPLWVPCVPAAVLAGWGWRRRAEARGFPVGP